MARYYLNLTDADGVLVERFEIETNPNDYNSLDDAWLAEKLRNRIPGELFMADLLDSIKAYEENKGGDIR